jgi:hypothetical protein
VLRATEGAARRRAASDPKPGPKPKRNITCTLTLAPILTPALPLTHQAQHDEASGTAAADGTGAEVPSNLSNQVDHLTSLLAQRFDRLQGDLSAAGGGDANDDDAFAPALRAAVSQVHDKLFET